MIKTTLAVASIGIGFISIAAFSGETSAPKVYCEQEIQCEGEGGQKCTIPMNEGNWSEYKRDGMHEPESYPAGTYYFDYTNYKVEGGITTIMCRYALSKDETDLSKIRQIYTLSHNAPIKPALNESGTRWSSCDPHYGSCEALQTGTESCPYNRK